jgi:DNA-binding transcriptional regulator LsrR (DeoR family)
VQLSNGALRCLEALKYYCRGKDNCWPKQETIAKQMGCSLRSVTRYIEELRVSGDVTSNRRPNTSCMYQLRGALALPETFGTSVGTSVALPPIKLYERSTLKTPSSNPWREDIARFGAQRAESHMLPGKEAEVEAWLKQRKEKHGW